MRRMIFVTLGVLIAALALCTFANLRVTRFTDRARHLRTEAVMALDEGDVQKAEVLLVELAGHLKANQALLEILCDRADLHELKGELIDAQASIEFGIEDDFYQAIYRFGEMLDHIAGVEELGISNFY